MSGEDMNWKAIDRATTEAEEITTLRKELAEARAENERLQLNMPLPSWQEQSAFEEFAREMRYDMHQHPLHYLFMDKQTNAARQGWKAALNFVRKLSEHRIARAALAATEGGGG